MRAICDQPAFGQLAGIAQIVYLDHRGNGRSDDSTADHWTLDQWADDLHGLIGILGLENVILYGASFGGFVAQAYACKYPDTLRGLILCATTAQVVFEEIFAAFTRFAGPEAGIVARDYWSAPTPEKRARYFEVCLPHYSQSKPDPDMMARMTVKNPVAMHFNGPGGEMGRFDFRADLARVTCPTMVLSGSHDPMMPVPFSDTLTAHLGNAPATHHTIQNAGHMIPADQPGEFFALMRDFIERNSSCD